MTETTTPGTEIAVAVLQNPVLALTQPEKFEDLYQHIKAEADSLETDLSTDKGRKAVASMAYKIKRTKTAIDDAGKKLNSEKRKEIDAVDEERRKVRARLDALAEDVRKPLTEWEEAEAQRQKYVAEVRDALDKAEVILADDTSETLAVRLREVRNADIAEDWCGMDAEALKARRGTVIDVLTDAINRAKKAEADRAELERLRREKEAEEQHRAEEEARKAAEVTRGKALLRHIEECKRGFIGGEPQSFGILLYELDTKITAEIMNDPPSDLKDRIGAAKDEAIAHLKNAMERQEKEREEHVRQEAAEAERRKAEEGARKEREAAEARAAQERAESEARERAAREEAEKLKAAEAERLRREQAEKDAAAARERDRKHRRKVMDEAKAAIMQLGADDATALKIVLAIVASEVPHCTLRF